MTQKEKQLLLQDLCARVPYGVKVNHFEVIRELLGIIPSAEIVMVGYDINDYEDSVIEDIKPYLRPMSSMTIDELDDCVMNSGLRDIPCPAYKGSEDEIEKQRLEHSIKVLKTDAYCIDWLNAHHFDYRGLINKGLALPATEGMYN